MKLPAPISRPTMGLAMCSTTSTAIIGAAAQAKARIQSRKIATTKITTTPASSTGSDPSLTSSFARCEPGSEGT